MVENTIHTQETVSNNSRIRNVMSDTKDMMYYYSILLNKWYWIVIGLAIGGLLFYINMRYSKEQYKVTGSVLIEDSMEKSLSKEAIIEGFGMDKTEATMEDKIRILGSTELMLRIVDSLNLNVSYIQEGQVKNNELFDNSPLKIMYWNTEGSEKSFQLKIKNYDSLRFTLFRSETQTELVNYNTPFKYGKRELVIKRIGTFDDKYPLIINVRDNYSVAKYFSSKLDIAQAGRSSILNVTMIDEVPERAIAIINRLVREYGVSIMETKNDAGRRTMDFIQQRLSYVASELYSVEKQEEGFKKDRDLPIMIPEIANNLIGRSNTIEAKIFGLEDRIKLVSNIESIISDNSVTGKYRPLPYSGEVLGSDPLIQLIGKYNDIIAKRNEMLESAKEGNPILSTYDESLRNLKNNILISVQTIKQEVNEQKERYRQQIIPLDNQIKMMPTNERELTQIMREKGIKETLFLFLLQKREEVALNVAAQVAHSRLLERAVNRGIVSPKPLQMGIFYIFLGLAIPIFGLYLKDLFNSKIHHRADIDKHVNLPFVGFIPHAKGRRGKLIINDSRSVLAESFRLVRSNLQNTATSQKSRTILITSTVSGEGKSMVAVNLALTFALTGKKIIILGLDLRKPKMEMYLEGKKSEDGLAQFLNGEKPIKNLIVKYDRLPNLDYIDCGNIPHNPSELMLTDKIKELFDYCNKNYDFVLVDGAPIGVVADTFLLKNFIGQTLYILRYGVSNTSHLKFLSEVNSLQKLPNINILLNDVRQERGNSYNYGFYSSYYYQEEKSVFQKIKRWFIPKNKDIRK